MPDRSPVKGVAFVEFSAREADAAAVAGILRTLGFRTTAQHRSKKRVSVFFQGNIRLLLNTQEPGFASASYTIRGTSAYAMAMTVDDAHDALDRAAALGAESSASRWMPAQHHPGNSRRGRRADLSSRRENRSRPHLGHRLRPRRGWRRTHDARRLRVDHVAQTVAYEEMLTWVLIYTSIVATPMVDIIDPLASCAARSSKDPRVRYASP